MLKFRTAKSGHPTTGMLVDHGKDRRVYEIGSSTTYYLMDERTLLSIVAGSYDARWLAKTVLDPGERGQRASDEG